MMTRFAVVSLWADDLVKTAHFYRDALGLRLLPQHGEKIHFDVDGIYLVIQRGKPSPADSGTSRPFPLFALQVEDLDASVRTLENQQVALPWSVENDANSRWVMFYDPGGNLVELVQFNAG
jgi:catechol 2,3-dioxygenase-like lactoylglutathione lyase family enzyme